MKHESKYDLGQLVFLATDPDKRARMIVSVSFAASGSIRYMLVCGTEDSSHYECELTIDKKKVIGFGQ